MLIYRASQTLQKINVDFAAQSEENHATATVEIPTPATHSFPALKRLTLTRWPDCVHDILHPQVITESREYLPLLKGIIPCTSSEQFQDFEVDKGISHEIVRAVLDLRGQHLKRLGILLYTHLPGMQAAVDAQGQMQMAAEAERASGHQYWESELASSKSLPKRMVAYSLHSLRRRLTRTR